MNATSQQLLDKMIGGVERFVKHRAEAVAEDIQVAIILTPKPIWTGLYSSGWEITFDTPAEPKELPEGHSDLAWDMWESKCTPYRPPPYPQIEVHHVDFPTAYQTVYFTNPYPHAAMIEHEGSPCHTEPWKVAANAQDRVLRDTTLTVPF